MDTIKQSEVDSIKILAICSCVQELALRKIYGKDKGTLLKRLDNALDACRDVQNWFEFHPNADEYYSEAFKKQFNSSEIVLLTDIIRLLFIFNEDGLEDLRDQLLNFNTELKNTTAFAPTEAEGSE
jgi:hypothetical protein